MPERFEFQMPNDLAELDGLARIITGHLEHRQAAPGAVYAANLALEELVTNIIKYGYDDSEEHLITVHLEIDAKRFRLAVIDDGHPFNPFDQPTPDTSLPLEQRQIGGLGIHFVRNMLDTHRYERRAGQNIVTVEKSMTQEGA